GVAARSSRHWAFSGRCSLLRIHHACFGTDLQGQIMRQIRIILATFAFVAIFGVAKVCAERAAGVDYDFIDRPANLPADFQASPGTNLRFLAIKAIDGFRVDAALWQPEANSPSSTTLIVGVHGFGGNFFSGSPIAAVSPLLAANGYGVLTI